MSEAVKTLATKAATALNNSAFAEVEACAKQILALDDSYADAWFFLSVTAAERRKVSVAIELVNSALRLSPRDAEYVAHKARLHTMAGQKTEAIAAADYAMTLKPDKPLVLDTLGVVYSRFEMHEQARDVLKLSVRVSPDNAQCQFNLASVEQFLGNAAGAEEGYRNAIRVKPDFYRAYWALSELEKNLGASGRLPALEELVRHTNLSPEDRLYLGHAISREYEKTGDYDSAFQTLSSGKEGMRAKVGYRIADDKKLFESVRQAFPVDGDYSSGDLGNQNIFVLGMPRSGTTLVDRILSSHSRIVSMGEVQYFAKAMKEVSGSRSQAMLDSELVMESRNIDFPEVGRRYLYEVGVRTGIKDFSLDKMPLNFLYVGFILRALPGAKIVCLRRHPVDTCLSNYRQLFAVNFSYYNYHYDLKDTAEYYCLFDELMAHWKAVFPDRFFELDYEAIVVSPEPTVRELSNYLGVGFEPACLEFYKSKSAVSTASAMQVREPLYSSAVNRWKQFGDHLAPVFEALSGKGISY
jgi:tetratricopeptide (TPR) repeat protein